MILGFFDLFLHAFKYDLSKRRKDVNVEDLLSQGRLKIFNDGLVPNQPSLKELWSELHNFLTSNENFSTNSKSRKKILRIFLSDLSSPLWADPENLPMFLGFLAAYNKLLLKLTT